MDKVFHLQNVEFEWDEEKYALNLRKHGVKFEEAAEGFLRSVCLFGRRFGQGRKARLFDRPEFFAANPFDRIH